MSTTQLSYTQSKTLNLLLKQQVVTKIDNFKEPTKNEIINFHQSVKVNDQETLSKFPANINCDDKFFDKCDDIKIQLGNIQLEESSSIEHYKSLCESYDLFENLLDHILQYVECVMLETKASNKLSLILNDFATQQPQPESLKFDNTPLDISEVNILQEIKNKLYNIQNKCEEIAEIRQEYERRRKDYQLALKNFKIILEVMNVHENCLEKLKQQFRDVVVEYRHCRTLLAQEMPYIMAERTRILGDCLIRLGEGNKKLIATRTGLTELMENIGAELNSSQYLVLK